MKTYETKVITEERSVCTGIFCDMCGAKAKAIDDEYSFAAERDTDGGGRVNWQRKLWPPYEPPEVTWDERTLCPVCAEWIIENLKKLDTIRRGEN